MTRLLRFLLLTGIFLSIIVFIIWIVNGCSDTGFVFFGAVLPAIIAGLVVRRLKDKGKAVFLLCLLALVSTQAQQRLFTKSGFQFPALPPEIMFQDDGTGTNILPIVAHVCGQSITQRFSVWGVPQDNMQVYDCSDSGLSDPYGNPYTTKWTVSATNFYDCDGSNWVLLSSSNSMHWQVEPYSVTGWQSGPDEWGGPIYYSNVIYGGGRAISTNYGPSWSDAENEYTGSDCAGNLDPCWNMETLAKNGTKIFCLMQLTNETINPGVDGPTLPQGLFSGKHYVPMTLVPSKPMGNPALILVVLVVILWIICLAVYIILKIFKWFDRTKSNDDDP